MSAYRSPEIKALFWLYEKLMEARMPRPNIGPESYKFAKFEKDTGVTVEGLNKLEHDDLICKTQEQGSDVYGLTPRGLTFVSEIIIEYEKRANSFIRQI